MKLIALFALLIISIFTLCNFVISKKETVPSSVEGTWQLVSATAISKGVSSFTDYTKTQSMIKIINKTHFAFLKHSLNTPKDSSNNFDAGGGAYTLVGNKYTEHLDYHSDKEWEGKVFYFTVTMNGDTLIQQGQEKSEVKKIDRIIIEKYLRVK